MASIKKRKNVPIFTVEYVGRNSTVLYERVLPGPYALFRKCRKWVYLCSHEYVYNLVEQARVYLREAGLEDRKVLVSDVCRTILDLDINHLRFVQSKPANSNEQVKARRSVREIDSELNEIREKILGNQVDTIRSVLETGRLLSRAQELLSSSGRGSRFGSWIRECFPFSKRTALNQINSYHSFHPERVAATWDAVVRIDITAMYKLSSNGKAANLAIAEAKRGERISVKRAEEILSKIKQPRKINTQKLARTITQLFLRDQVSPADLLSTVADAYGWIEIQSAHRSKAAEIAIGFAESEWLAEWERYCREQCEQLKHVADIPGHVPEASLKCLRALINDAKKFGEFEEQLKASMKSVP